MATCSECTQAFPAHALVHGARGLRCHGCELDHEQRAQAASLVFTQGLTGPMLAMLGSLGLVAVSLPGAAPLALAGGVLLAMLALGAALRTGWLAVFGDGYSELAAVQRGALALSAAIAVPWSTLLLLGCSGGLVVWTLQYLTTAPAA